MYGRKSWPQARHSARRLTDLEEVRLDALEAVFRDLGQSRDHALDARARHRRLDRRLREAHHEEKSAVAIMAPAVCWNDPTATPSPTRWRLGMRMMRRCAGECIQRPTIPSGVA